jgi:hypothetical protein
MDEKPRLMPVDVLGGMLLRFEILSAERPISPNRPREPMPPVMPKAFPVSGMSPFLSSLNAPPSRRARTAGRFGPQIWVFDQAPRYRYARGPESSRAAVKMA